MGNKEQGTPWWAAFMGASTFFGRTHLSLSGSGQTWATEEYGINTLLSCNTPPCDVNDNDLCMVGGSEKMLEEPVRSKRWEEL